MSAVDWNTLCHVATAALLCGLSLRFSARANVAARLLPVKARRRKGRNRITDAE